MDADAAHVVVDAVRTHLADAEGRASAAEGARHAAAALEQAQANLDAAVRAFAAAGLDAEASAVERLTELRQLRDEAQLRLDRIGGDTAYTVRAAVDWDELTVDERRKLIRATVESAIVAPTGRGGGRIDVRLFGRTSPPPADDV